MKRFIAVIIVLFVVQTTLLANQETGSYPIEVTTMGDNALVDAIKKYSDITTADAHRWGLSWVPLLGATIRDRMINKVVNFIKTYNGFILYGQGNRNYHTDIQKYNAFQNLEKQAEAARVLLNRFGNAREKQMYESTLNVIIGDIAVHNERLAPIGRQMRQTQITKSQQQLEEYKNKLEINKLWWRTNELRWKMVKDMSLQAFRGAKWIAQTAYENQGQALLSTAAAWYVFNRMFGIKN